MPDPVVIDGMSLRLEAFDEVARRGRACVLAEHARAAVEAGQAAVRRVLDAGDAMYGVNTGFGDLASVRIAPDRIVAAGFDERSLRGADGPLRQCGHRRSGRGR